MVEKVITYEITIEVDGEVVMTYHTNREHVARYVFQTMSHAWAYHKDTNLTMTDDSDNPKKGTCSPATMPQ